MTITSDINLLFAEYQMIIFLLRLGSRIEKLPFSQFCLDSSVNMSKTSTSVKVNGAYRRSAKLHVGTFMTEINLGELAEPIKMYRKPQSNETRKAQPTHRFGYIPPPVDEKVRIYHLNLRLDGRHRRCNAQQTPLKCQNL